MSASSQNVARHDVMHIVPWVDPVVDQIGYPVHDPYIEMFWLPVLGPTATWLYRRLVAGLLDADADSFDVDMSNLARSIGVSNATGRHNPFSRALHRCTMFGATQQIAVEPVLTLAVRRFLPTLPHRHLQRLPEQLQIAHHDWIHVPNGRDSQYRGAHIQ